MQVTPQLRDDALTVFSSLMISTPQANTKRLAITAFKAAANFQEIASAIDAGTVSVRENDSEQTTITE